MPQQIFKLRQSFAILFFRMIGVEIFVAVFYTLIQLTTDRILNTFFVPQIVNILLLSYFLLRWTTTYYMITPTEITVGEGIIIRQRNTWKVNAVQSINMKQSAWGRLFNYGNVILESPFLKRELTLRNISEPELYAEYLENFRSKAQEENTNALPRRV